MSFFSFSKFHLLFRVFLFAVSVIFFGWILNENVPIAGIKKIMYTFGTPNGIVTQLRPMARLGQNGIENGISYQKIIEDPVYFDVRTPITYDTMSVEVLYKKHTSRQFGLGIKQFPTQISFFTAPFVSVGTEGEWNMGRVEIPLQGIDRMPGKYSLSLSLQGLEYNPKSDEYILVSRAEITLKRKPLSIEDIKSTIGKLF